MKDTLGGNCFSIGIFTVQQGQKEQNRTRKTLTYLQVARKIQNYPVVNDQKMLGLLHKYRYEMNQIALNASKGGGGGTGDLFHQKIADLEKKLIEDNLDKMKATDERSKLA